MIQAAICGAEAGQLIERPVSTGVAVLHDPAQFNDPRRMYIVLIAALRKE